MTRKKEKFIIVDGNALLHRAFHAVPPLTTKKGVLVNAVYGFTTILMRVMKELKPKYTTVTFDLKAPTFRHKEYDDYKANRIKQPDELYDQLEPIKEVVKAFNIPIYEQEGFEADDLIGTVNKKLEKNKEIDTYIITGDLDALQLVDNNTFVYTLKRTMADTIIYDDKQVQERYGGLKPNQLIDYKALRGDPSDNIPGVRGIGEKTAIELLNEFGTLKNLYQKYANSRKIKPRIKELLQEYKQDAFMSQKLATIVTNVPIDFDLKKNEFTGVNREKIVKLFQELEFKTLLGKIPELETKLQVAPINNKEDDTTNNKYNLVNNEKSLKSFLYKLAKQKEFAIDTETSDLNPLTTDLIGISISWQAGSAYYLDYQAIKKSKDLKTLSKILSNPKIKKIGHNIKFDMASLSAADFDLQGVSYDTMLAAYLLNPGERRLKLDTLIFSEFGYQMTPIEELIGKKGKGQLAMSEVDTNKLSRYACEDADYTWQLYQKLKPELDKLNFNKLMDEVEVPLIPVLFTMEKNGVLIDKKYLDKINKKVTKDIASLEKRIHILADQKFNIASPLQLKKILFNKLNIPTENLKKTKTGFSTAAGELEKMRHLHPIINLISEYRELTKLKSTYIEALPQLINNKTGRVHTSFNQTITATGRLSSSDPNLQNIPIRTSLGKKIRGAFIADGGNKLVAADYSQIELRVVAHLSEDQNMLKTFQKNQDIHTTTAAFIFDLPLKDIDSDMRRKAKEVNFGVMYGMGAWGLAERTGISRPEAKEFIDRYFAKYSAMKKFTEMIVEYAKKNGYVETILGRRRYLPEINSGVAMVRNAAQRAAINHPIQGTSADIMKLAMIAVHNNLQKNHPDVKPLMQVHDELVLEVPEKKVPAIAKLLKTEMENVVKLKVPLIVNVKVGDNWLEMSSLQG